MPVKKRALQYGIGTSPALPACMDALTCVLSSHQFIRLASMNELASQASVHTSVQPASYLCCEAYGVCSRINIFVRTVAILMAFATGMALGIYSVEKTDPVVVAPLQIDFCSLATNQDYLVGARIQTTAKMSLGLEGSVLESESCPASILVFRPPSNDTCW